MKDANPIALIEDLKSVLQRYISTTLPISRRYPNLANEFRSLLSQQTLVEGPYVEALPDFEKGESINSLLRKNGGFLHDSLGLAPTAGRKLHKHQQLALEYACKEKKSILVATGTGSGKTESFLYPIAEQLLSDPEPDKPGVRALLIYPMNALANDQLYYRIAPLFGNYLAKHGITFGRYTGQVKANVKREEEVARLLSNQKLMPLLGDPDTIPSNWMLTREEMLNNPPKVLITNYAMLEHLLLLPRNERLFSANALRFIVLDEIHTYHGAQATEVAFLLRKLKTRLGVSTPLQVFGTSASLSDGPDADEKLKAFACDLFGEPVHEVVRGKRIVHERLATPVPSEFSLSIPEWCSLGVVIEAMLKLHEEDRVPDSWNFYLEEHGFRQPELSCSPELSWAQFLEERFAANREIRRVAQFLDCGGVRNFVDLANLVFDSPVDQADSNARFLALSAVIRLGMLARATDDGFPLLPGRYHIAVNSIEGIATLPSSGSEGWSKLKAARNYRDEEGQYFALLTCRKCGQPYIEGFEAGGYLHNRQQTDGEAKGERRVFWLGSPVGYVEDEDDEVEATGPKEFQKFWLDVKTGELAAREGSIALHAIQTQHDEQEKAWYVKKCPACGGSSSGAEAEVVTRMHPGNEALGSVVTQRVLESLPAGIIDNYDPRPAQGRNLLTFSDNRQDAAFFAPYFERTAIDVAFRSAIRNVLKETGASLTAPQLAERIYQFWQQDGQQAMLLDANGEICHDHQDVLAILLGFIGNEVCTPGGRRNSVEALGVVKVTYDEQRLRMLTQKVKTFWPSSLPSDDKTLSAIVHIFLENIRRERAISKFHKVALSDDYVWGIYSGHRSFDLEGGDANVRFKWVPTANRHNRRSWYLVEQLGMPRDEAIAFLKHFWEALVRPPVLLLERYQPGFALNGESIRFSNGDHAILYVCKNCGLMQQHVVNHKCTAFNCRGDVELITDEQRDEVRKRNHYLASYDETSHAPVRAREHTASLSTDLREDIERKFAERKINLLSCTTTMEMGVDLGDLEAVVNLNVPPGIANYQQRTGRAGRRAQAAPFCVTVARNTNFDQAAVRHFPEYLASTPGTPFIHLDNEELFKRHQFSVLLSHFLRWRISDRDINAPSLVHLFGELFARDELTAFTEALLGWFEAPQGATAVEEAEALIERLPEAVRSNGAKGSRLRNLFAAAVREFAQEICERFAKYTEKMVEAATAIDFKKAGYWQKMRDDFMGQLLVDQLSKRGLIPTYSFPVHSLNLEVLTETKQSHFGNQSDVVLSRDASLGISEYAPGSEVVANGRIWESAGLAHYPKAFMPERWYVACPECFHVDIGETIDEIPPACSNCGAADSRRKRKFIEPHGFVTSLAQRRGRDPGSSRRRVKAADEAKLIAAPRDEIFEDTGLPFLSSAFLSAKASGENGLRGSLFISNRGAYGEGYYRCSYCNYCEPIKSKKAQAPTPGKPSSAGTEAKLEHTDPQTGLRCKNDKMSRTGIDFVHRFETDVRLFRFIQDLPEPESAEIDPRRFHERVARTLAESFRLAVTKLLELYPGEVRAIYRLHGQTGKRLEVVLYDGVPGGAGYCARLGESGYSYSRLVEEAHKQLDCPDGCDSGCRTCLCDYSNQRYWDGFERKAALEWITKMLNPNTAESGPGNFVRWKSPSLAGLSERLGNFPVINLLARSLVDVSGYSDESLGQLISWLQEGKKLNIYLANKLDEKPKAQAPLKVYRRLHPYLLEGKVTLYALSEKLAANWEALPRIFVGITVDAPIIRQHFAVHSLLERLISAPAEVGTIDAEFSSLLQHVIDDSTAYKNDVLREGERMQMWELPRGTPRNLENIFSPAMGAYVKSLEIRDPYCATVTSVSKLKDFLGFIKSSTGSVENLRIRCRENKDRDGYVEFYLDVERRVDDMVKNMGYLKRDIEVIQLRGAGKSFHDREVDIVTVTDDGCECMHRYFLTGGIDFLMDERSETRIFYIKIDR